MSQENRPALFRVLADTFSKSTMKDLESHYFPRVASFYKWTCLSDYCFGDKDKPNDTVTFSLLPYINDFKELSEFINSIARVDIKKTKKFSEEFASFLKTYPLINFTFILNDKQRIFGKNGQEIKEELTASFQSVKDQLLIWIKNQPEQVGYYQNMIKKIDQTLLLIKNNKKIKQIVELVLVTYLGAFVSSLIVKKTKPELFGWLSDRDAINEVSKQLSTDLFSIYLFGFSDSQNMKFVSAPATSLDKPFYDELLKIPDYITGTLADYNFDSNEISKDKFDQVLTNYMAENKHNNFVFRINRDDSQLNCSRITISKKSLE